VAVAAHLKPAAGEDLREIGAMLPWVGSEMSRWSSTTAASRRASVAVAAHLKPAAGGDLREIGAMLP